MRTIVIASINGCFYEFNELLKKIKRFETDKIYLLGNVANGGPEPYHVLNHVYHLKENFIIVQGNFERNLKLTTQNEIEDLHSEFNKFLYKFPTRELGFFHVERLKNAPLCVQLPFCNIGAFEYQKIINFPTIVERVFTLKKPFITVNKQVYIDTDCLHGGSLTAVVIDNEHAEMSNWEYVSVPARKNYAN